jgi:3'-5' exoribonuclease
MKIFELTPGPGLVEVTGLVSESSVKEAKNGKPFVRFTLVDGRESVACMQFNYSVPPVPGTVLDVSATVDEFNGATQLKAVSWLPSYRDPSEFVPASKFSKFSKFDLEMLLDGALKQIGGRYEPVVRAVFDEHTRNLFLEAPAAKGNHHSFERGLAEHTLSMFCVADAVCAHYSEWYPTSINRSLLLAGVLLHDLGKIVDFKRVGVTWEYTLDGEMVNHMAHAVVMVHDACMATCAEPATERELTHMILSHHGQLEWGSPVTPKIIEAQLLHFIDNMDARSEMFRSAGATPGEMTSEWIRPLGGRVTRVAQ